MSVEAQENDPDAMLHHYRKAIQFRQIHLVLAIGEHSDLSAKDNVVTFNRILNEQIIHCAFNLSDTPSEFTLPDGDWQPLGEELGCVQNETGSQIHLGPWQVYIGLKREHQDLKRVTS